MRSAPTRCALYTRVSTSDGRQTVENQLRELRAYAGRRGWEVVLEFTDDESGRKARAERAGLDAMLKAAARREFDVLLVWSLDRLTREGLRAVIDYLRALDAHGVRFHSYTEEVLSTDNELVRDVLLTILAHLAKIEAERISTRTKAGLERARAQGTRLGRPRKTDAIATRVRALADEAVKAGDAINAAAIHRRLRREGHDVHYNTVRNTLAALRPAP